MERIELEIKDKKVSLYGKKGTIVKEINFIKDLALTGNEHKDRLLIQDCIDTYKLKSDILYDGSSVYSFEKIVKAYRKLQKKESLDTLTEEMYHFFTDACGDIAHYSIGGFKDYYNNSIKNLENTLLKHCSNSSRFTDIDKIFSELKIGKYFDEREFIDISELPVKKLKSSVEECGWSVLDNKKSWKIHKCMLYDTEFSFDVNIKDKNTYDIFDSIDFFSNHFDSNDYAEKLFESNNGISLKISEIVYLSNYIAASLRELTSDILYKCRYLAEEERSILNHKKSNIKFEGMYLMEQDIQENSKENNINNDFELL